MEFENTELIQFCQLSREQKLSLFSAWLDGCSIENYDDWWDDNDGWRSDPCPEWAPLEIYRIMPVKTHRIMPVKTSAEPASDENAASCFDMLAHLQRMREFSERTFGPNPRAKGIISHIRKELREIEADPTDLFEWVDVVILALDGLRDAGASPQQIIDTLVAKQITNEARVWPDWRTVPAGCAIEHDRSHDASAAE